MTDTWHFKEERKSFIRWRPDTTDKRPTDEATRIIKRFLILPTNIDFQTRWLEFSSIEQEYRRSYFDSDWKWHDWNCWCNRRWIDIIKPKNNL